MLSHLCLFPASAAAFPTGECQASPGRSASPTPSARVHWILSCQSWQRPFHSHRTTGHLCHSAPLPSVFLHGVLTAITPCSLPRPDPKLHQGRKFVFVSRLSARCATSSRRPAVGRPPGFPSQHCGARLGVCCPWQFPIYEPFSSAPFPSSLSDCVFASSFIDSFPLSLLPEHSLWRMFYCVKEIDVQTGNSVGAQTRRGRASEPLPELNSVAVSGLFPVGPSFSGGK